MELLLEDGVLVETLELGLEVTEYLSATVGSTTLVGEVVTIVLTLLAISAPGNMVNDFQRTR